MLTMLEPGGIAGAKCCININGAVTLTPTVCSHSTDVISQKGLYDCDARVVHEQIQRIPSDVMDEIGNTRWHGKVMNQADHMRTMVLHCLADFRKRAREEATQHPDLPVSRQSRGQFRGSHL
jgi:hypothetical protein